MNSTPQICNNLFYREERNGSILVHSKYGMKFLNRTSSLILKNINGINTVKDILKIFKEKYKNVSEMELEEDIVKCLYAFKTLNYIVWKGITKNMGELNEKLKIEIVGEEDYSRLSSFICDSVEENRGSNIILEYIPGCFDKAYYSDISLRTRQFHFSEINFISEREEKITSWLSIIGLHVAGETISISGFISSKEYVEDLYYTYVYVEKLLKENKRIKIKLSLYESDMNEQMNEFIEKTGFTKEAVLEKEVHGLDTHIFKKIL